MTSKKKNAGSSKKPSAKKAGATAKKSERSKKTASADEASKSSKSKTVAKKKTATKGADAKSAPKKEASAKKKKTATGKKSHPKKSTKVTSKEITKQAKATASKSRKADTKKTAKANPSEGQAKKSGVGKSRIKAGNGSVSKSKFVYKPNPSLLDAPQEGNSTPGRRYSDADLKEFKDLILKKLEAARKEVNYLQGLITRKGEAGTDDTENKYMSVEDGSGTMEREQLSQLASRQIQYIDHLEKALMRIENKTYGICRVTGKLIDKARLRAVPHATLSIEAKQKMQR